MIVPSIIIYFSFIKLINQILYTTRNKKEDINVEGKKKERIMQVSE